MNSHLKEIYWCTTCVSTTVNFTSSLIIDHNLYIGGVKNSIVIKGKKMSPLKNNLPIKNNLQIFLLEKNNLKFFREK